MIIRRLYIIFTSGWQLIVLMFIIDVLQDNLEISMLPSGLDGS